MHVDRNIDFSRLIEPRHEHARRAGEDAAQNEMERRLKTSVSRLGMAMLRIRDYRVYAHLAALIQAARLKVQQPPAARDALHLNFGSDRVAKHHWLFKVERLREVDSAW